MKKAYKFDFQNNEFVFESKDAVVLTGYEALKQWIEKCIRTQLNRYTMYNGTAYGANIEDLTIGHSYGIDFVESELRREIENALLAHEDINRVPNLSVTRAGDILHISFTLSTSYGTLTEVFEF